MKGNTKKIAVTALIAAVYAVLTISLGFMSYSNIQFRVAEIMILLAFIDKDYIPGLTLGCFLANILGVYGIPDTIFGTLATFISACLVYQTGKQLGKSTMSLIIASLWPAVVNALIIGWMLNKFVGLPLILSMAQVGIGEFVVITIAGIPLFKAVEGKYGILVKNAFN
ncbi:QueT transporter family protein [Metaclostridioides mangenotii]|uniref:QueT transporter family protein n=1 Tax=Metaclostridioides mangenotii TaxID=1540 RepID=UPI0004673C33|nr:QueT transporter family protein [Clostridioides mangenotii]